MKNEDLYFLFRYICHEYLDTLVGCFLQSYAFRSVFSMGKCSNIFKMNLKLSFDPLDALF